MTTTERHSTEAGGTAGSRGVDLKLEVVVIPVSDADRSKELSRASDGGSMPTSLSTTGFASSSSHPPVRCARSNWHQDHGGGARFGSWPVPDRSRHRGGARGAP